jgi:hypothetical protein
MRTQRAALAVHLNPSLNWHALLAYSYEDVEYEKRLLKIKTTDDDASHEAFAYVWPLKNKHLLEGAWSYEQFRSDHLPE